MDQQIGNKKLLLMGPGGSGKTSMRSIIFTNLVAKHPMATFTPTVSVEQTQVRFMGSLVLNLWDCGGQSKFMESYFGAKEEHIFKNVAVMIFVIDVTSTEEKDIEDYKTSMELLQRHSNSAKVFCLVHKMDLIPKEQRNTIFDEKKAILEANALGIEAWSTVVYALIPNSKILAEHLEQFCLACEADEIVLFERDTFLDISHSTRKDAQISTQDIHRFEKVSNIIKTFKLHCLNLRSYVKNIHIHTTQFDVYIYEFTESTFIMLIIADPHIKPATTIVNINNAKVHFEKLIKSTI